MSFFRKRLRLRWPSKNHRDYQTPGCLAPRSSRPSEILAPSLEERAPDARLPALGRIVGVQHEDAVLRIDLAAYRVAWSGRSHVQVPDVTAAHAAGAGASSERDDTPTWTITVILN